MAPDPPSSNDDLLLHRLEGVRRVRDTPGHVQGIQLLAGRGEGGPFTLFYTFGTGHFSSVFGFPNNLGPPPSRGGRGLVPEQKKQSALRGKIQLVYPHRGVGGVASLKQWYGPGTPHSGRTFPHSAARQSLWGAAGQSREKNDGELHWGGSFTHRHPTTAATSHTLLQPILKATPQPCQIFFMILNPQPFRHLNSRFRILCPD